MRVDQLEAWVLSVVDRVNQQLRVEDSRVELKGDWPTPAGAARRIGGHANASHGDSVLWIIGLDEDLGVTTTTAVDLARWWPQVLACFDGIGPSLADLVVPTATGAVTALLFDTSRRPFVVRNASYGKQGGGQVSLEVPWREGTSIRSARRDDLVRILVPLQDLPDVEVLSSTVDATLRPPANPRSREKDPIKLGEYIDWRFIVEVYLTPRMPHAMTVLPVHRMRFGFRFGQGEWSETSNVQIVPPTSGSRNGAEILSDTISANAGETILTGPGKAYVRARFVEPNRSLPDSPMEVALRFSPAGSDMVTTVTTTIDCLGELRWGSPG